MIKDKLKYAKNYYPLSDKIKKGLEWLIAEDFTNINDGRYDLGTGLYANIQTYETKSEADYETHKKYIDIQYIVSGREFVGVADKDNCITITPYSEEKDIEFLTFSGKENYQNLQEGEFLILFPNDAHKPSINPDIPTKVKKIVVKIPID